MNPPGTVEVVTTWVCVHCHRGWPQPAGTTATCARCGRPAQQRGSYITVALTADADGDAEGNGVPVIDSAPPAAERSVAL